MSKYKPTCTPASITRSVLTTLVWTLKAVLLLLPHFEVSRISVYGTSYFLYARQYYLALIF